MKAMLLFSLVCGENVDNAQHLGVHCISMNMHDIELVI